MLAKVSARCHSCGHKILSGPRRCPNCGEYTGGAHGNAKPGQHIQFSSKTCAVLGCAYAAVLGKKYCLTHQKSPMSRAKIKFEEFLGIASALIPRIAGSFTQAAKTSALGNLTTQELRGLAVDRGMAGARLMSRKGLLRNLRGQPTLLSMILTPIVLVWRVVKGIFSWIVLARPSRAKELSRTELKTATPSSDPSARPSSVELPRAPSSVAVVPESGVKIAISCVNRLQAVDLA